MRPSDTKELIDVPSLFPEVDEISNIQLREAVIQVWQDLWQLSEFNVLDDVPVAAHIPYSQRKHCQGIVRAALAVAEVWESVHGAEFDHDTLIAGALLMDVSKLVEIRPGDTGSVEATDIGRNLPHAFFAAHRALELGVPLHIVHIMTTHSPNSGMAPSTPECHLLDWIDQADVAAFGYNIWSRRVVHFLP